MSWVSEEMLDVMWRLLQSAQALSLGSFFILLLYEPGSLQYPDLNCARVAHSFLVRSFSES